MDKIKDFIVVLAEIMPGTPILPDGVVAPKGHVFAIYTDRLEGEQFVKSGDDGLYQPSDFLDKLRTEGGRGSVFVPFTDFEDDPIYFCLIVTGITRDHEATARINESVSKLAKGLMIGSLFGSILAGTRKAPSIADLLRDADAEENAKGMTEVERQIGLLTPESTIVVMPANYRGDDPSTRVEVTFDQYTRMEALNMIDPCPVCTLREKRLVCHTEDGYDMSDVLKFVGMPLPNATAEQ